MVDELNLVIVATMTATHVVYYENGDFSNRTVCGVKQHWSLWKNETPFNRYSEVDCKKCKKWLSKNNVIIISFSEMLQKSII